MTDIDYTKLEKKRLVQSTHYITKKLPEGVYACPNCYGSGRVTTIYRDPWPNKMGECFTCRGTGEIKKCKHSDCQEPVPNSEWSPYGLCLNHEREYIEELIKNDKKVP